MLLAVDIGNSNITLGVFSDNSLVCTARLSTDRSKTADQYAAELAGVLRLHGVDSSDIGGCSLCSVVPVLTSAFVRAVRSITGKRALVVGPGVKTGLNIRIDNPAQLGADLAAGAVAAVADYKLPCIIIDMGTATTISVIDGSGMFIGGCICAGAGISLEALTDSTSQLPSIELTAPDGVIGKNTVDCMKSGLVVGTAAMLDGLIERIEQQLGDTASLVATGGLAPDIIKHCRRDIDYNGNLLLDGLKKIYEKNSKM